LRRKIANFLFSPFFVGSPERRAFAASLGLLLSALPLAGFNGWALLLVAWLGRLNLLALAVGFCTYLLVPLVEWGILLLKPDAAIPDGLVWSAVAGIVLSALFYPLFLWMFKGGKRMRGLEKRMFVFQDDGRRWSFLKRSFVYTLVLCLASLAVFADGLRTDAVVPQVVADSGDHGTIIPVTIEWNRLKPNKTTDSKQGGMLQKKADFPPGYRPVTYGFYVPWDPRGFVELKEYGYIDKLDVLIPQWYAIGDDFLPVVQKQPEVDELAKKHGVQVMPLVNNVHGGKWDGELLHRLLVDPKKRAAFIQDLLADVKNSGYAGINVDFEAVRPDDRKRLTQFIKELASAFHREGLQVTQDVPANDRAFDYAALAKITDKLVVMLYDEHFVNGSPGPLASLEWVWTTLKRLPVPKEKLVASLGIYGYDWTVGSREPAIPLSFDEIMFMANKHGLRVFWDKASKTSYLRYKKDGKEHIVWFLDGATFHNQLKAAALFGVRGVALWRIGSEDLSVWNIFGKTGRLSAAESMETFGGDVPLYRGEGEILRITSRPGQGERTFERNINGWIVKETYKKYSTPFTLERMGKPAGKTVALTFDDGPDPDYTGKILDILDRYRVKASFFIIGENGVRHPDLVKRMVEEGHDVGNHTYTHAYMSQVSDATARLEMQATQRFFQGLTGRTMTLFRPPYQAGAVPVGKDDWLPLERAQEKGYLTVGELVDSEDWRIKTDDGILRQVMKEFPNGNILLFHDGGGDRSATVKALPHLIEMLQKQGYRFVTVSQLLGKTGDQVMPPVHPSEQPYVEAARVAFTVLQVLQQGFDVLLAVAITMGFVRIFLLMVFSFKQRKNLWRRRRKQTISVVRWNYNPLVSVVIAAYNEEKVINKTIRSVLNSDYRPLEIIIVNDGSTDRTEEVILEEFGGIPGIHIITKPNSGKTDSINVGYRYANGEIIVSIDADTIIAEDAISLMVRHFVDEKVAAVSGNVKVGNVRNLLTLWQHVEYITGFNLERRAFDQLNSIPVVPGAIGAWRKRAVEEAGFFQHDTLAEDTDITLALLRLGYKVHYEDRAYAYTEAPEDVKSFIKQRTRWIYGTLQCLWKHRGALFSGRQKSLGFITLPNMWGFQYGVQLMSPFVDLLCIASFFTSSAARTLLFYVAFLIFDMIAAFFAFSLEKESPKPLIWLFLQRFVYRQFMTYIVFKSIYLALKGVTVGWNKLVRKGNVPLGSAAKSAG
jgi:cellulose synthase/poly-beta-1,6-N-acetylglucosamine synthase-like glycosyltransferase/peptidoglycan/xylan/chitin deacetylase (PgdA/CDA1 family)